MKRKIFSILFALVLVLSVSLIPAVPVMATGTTTTLSIPDNVYRPAPFDVSSTTTNDGTAYTNVRFNITVSGPEAFTGAREDIFTITHLDGNPNTQGINDTFVLVDGDFVGYWGPETGFTLPAPYSATSTFTVQMTDVTTAPVGNYDLTVELVDLTPDPDVPLATATDGFDLSADTLYVGAGQQFTTIQAAIDAASPYDTITVAAGTYDEQVVIDKSLTLQGAGDTTVIQPSTTTANALTVKSVPWYGGGSKDMAAIVWVDTSGGTVTVKDLKIDGVNISETDKPAAIGSDEWVTGLAYLETSGTVDTVTVEDVYISDGVYRTCGIWTSAITHTSTVEVKYCTVINNNRAGIYGLGAELTVNFNHNTMTGPGTLANQVPNGIFLMEDCTGSATYNTVSQYHYSGGTYKGTGIGTYATNAGSITFGHNTIFDVDNAFCLSAGTTGVTIEYNTVTSCWTGVRLESSGTGNNIIQYNDILNNTYAIRCASNIGVDNEAHYNSFVGNVGTGMTGYEGAVSLYTGSTYTFDAIYNWWGDVSGPGGVGTGSGDTVGANVDYDPWIGQGGMVTGGGTIWSSAGYYRWNLTAEGEANFGFVAKYKKGANTPEGHTNFVFEAGGLHFRSSEYDWLVAAGDTAKFKGVGTIEGASGIYKFMLWAGDGVPDTFRIKIWEEVDGFEDVVYDNGSQQAITGGNIFIHKSKK